SVQGCRSSSAEPLPAERSRTTLPFLSVNSLWTWLPPRMKTPRSKPLQATPAGNIRSGVPPALDAPAVPNSTTIASAAAHRIRVLTDRVITRLLSRPGLGRVQPDRARSRGTYAPPT